MALATSKRKFYKLLDNLSSSKTNLVPPAKNPPVDRPIKKSRMVEAKTTVRILSSNFESRSSPNRTVSNKATPIYAPWSHDQFLARLKTFSDVKLWSSKPDSINEVAWAKRGWIAIALDEVSCRSCGQRVLLKLDHPADQESASQENGRWWSEEVGKKLIEKYELLIIDGHESDCLWRKSGSKGA
jgi:hypothetical protein